VMARPPGWAVGLTGRTGDIPLPLEALLSDPRVQARHSQAIFAQFAANSRPHGATLASTGMAEGLTAHPQAPRYSSGSTCVLRLRRRDRSWYHFEALSRLVRRQRQAAGQDWVPLT